MKKFFLILLFCLLGMTNNIWAYRVLAKISNSGKTVQFEYDPNNPPPTLEAFKNLIRRAAPGDFQGREFVIATGGRRITDQNFRPFLATIGSDSMFHIMILPPHR